MILVIGDPIDAHVRLVLHRLREKGAEAARFDLGEFPRECSIAARFDDASPRVLVRREEWRGDLDLARVRTVWLRRLSPVRLDPAMSESDAAFARTEANAFLYSLGAALEGDRFWVNPLVPALATDRGNGKLSQLALARTVGLEVPQTLATNDPAAAREFLLSCKEGAIYKPFLAPTRNLAADEGDAPRWATIFTTKLDAKALARLDGVRHAPCIFQELVPKKVELRVTVMGDKVFATEIHSQVDERSAVDFRRHYALDATPYAVHEMPPVIAMRCLELNRALGCVFGAFDFIVTPDGRYVFLETNQQGQFLWLEVMTGQPLLENFCELLIQGRPDFRCDAPAHAPGPLPEVPDVDPREL